MNKVITINLGGIAYQLEEGGYEALRAYLETAAARLTGNPDRDEIVSDIERAIGEKFRALLKSNKNVVEEKEVAAVLKEMGPIEAPTDEATGSSAGTSATSEAGPQAKPGAAPGNPLPRRLYRISEGEMLAGVCNGLGAYFNIDPTFIRLGFVIAFMVWGAGLLIYIVLAIILPEARSPEEKAAASGSPATAQEYIRRAKEGYYQAMKNFPDRNARREWTRQFRENMRAHAEQWKHNWHSNWPKQPPPPGMTLTLPFLSLLNGLATIVFVCLLISVLSTDSIFGRPLPGDFPAWGAAIVLALVYEMVTQPLKRARRACYGTPGQQGSFGSFFFLFDAVVWLAVVVALACLAAHFFPELRDAFQSFPKIVHQGAHDISEWWNQK